MSRGVLFGEALLRFSTARGERLLGARSLDFFLGGSELNIAANLQALGVPCDWVSVLPSGAMGEFLLSKISETGVRPRVAQASGEAGWYLLESGATPRPDRVLARVASVLAKQTSFDFDWGAFLSGASFFHTSGITAGLSADCTNEVARGMRAAHELGVPVSYDFNFRRNIWSLEESRDRQKPLLGLIDILFGSRQDLELHYGWSEASDPTFQAFLKSSGVKVLVMSRRSSDEREYAVDIVTASGTSSATFPVVSIDRIGMGDAMAAGFWASYLEDRDLARAASWAAASGALKATIQGDMSLILRSEIESLVKDGYRGVER